MKLTAHEAFELAERKVNLSRAEKLDSMILSAASVGSHQCLVSLISDETKESEVFKDLEARGFGVSDSLVHTGCVVIFWGHVK